MSKRNNEIVLSAVYFPFQLLIGILISPVLVLSYAFSRAADLAFEDVFMTKDNPMVNQDGPTMDNKRKHWWITRFVGLDVLMEDDRICLRRFA